MEKRKWVYVILVIAVIVSVILANVVGVFSGEIGCRITVTTSIYATLITILLALLALAVTAYIFLATALKERRESYEQKTVEQMLAVRTKHLLFLAVLGIFSLGFCFLIDNADSGFKFLTYLHFLTITGSSIVCVLLMIYICAIITYEQGLKIFAGRARRKLFSSKLNKCGLKDFARRMLRKLSSFIFRGENDQDRSVFKFIGDLEMLVMTLVANHKDNFHSVDASDAIRAIIESKTDQLDKSDEFVEDYNKLIAYRDFLRVEQQNTNKAIWVTPEEYTRVQGTIKKLEDGLKKKYLAGERLKNLNFVAPFLQISKEQFSLKATVFSESAFENVNFENAQLYGADFSRTRLNEVNFKSADCTEGIFSEAVFREIKVDTGSIFRNAVFRNTDFSRQKFETDSNDVFCFESASFVQANLIECIFSACDFRYANFNRALMTSIVLDSVCLSYANLSQAILTKANCSFEQKKADSFPREEYWKNNRMEEGEGLSFGYIDSWHGKRLGAAFFVNLEQSTLSQASISAYNFVGSRMADANFSDAGIKNCIFDRCYGQRATFQEATIQFCRFQYAMFDTSDFSYAEIIDCDFSDVNLRDCLMVKAKVHGNAQVHACFQRANFTNAQLRGCRFTNCDFRGARFTDADLLGAIFKNCDLTGALFDGTDHDAFTVENNCIGYTKEKYDMMNKRELHMEENVKYLSVSQVIQSRKSTRSFNNTRTIPRDDLDRLLQAALQAPSPKNRQPWFFKVVTKKDEQKELAEILEKKLSELHISRVQSGQSTDDLDLARGSVRVLQDASALVFVTYIRDEENEHGDPHKWNLSAQPFEVADLQSIGAAIENLILTANALAIDSLWICDVLYAYQNYMDYLKLKNPLIACVALGYQTLHHTPKASLAEKVEYSN